MISFDIFRYLQTAMQFDLNIFLISNARLNQSHSAQPVYLLKLYNLLQA